MTVHPEHTRTMTAPALATPDVPLRIAIETTHVILTPLVPRLDAHHAIALRAVVLAHIEPGPRPLIVNLQHVEWLDSSALSVLVTAFQWTVRAGGSFAVRTLHTQVRALFARTHLDRVIPISEPARAANSPARRISPTHRRRCRVLTALWGTPGALERPAPTSQTPAPSRSAGR